MKKVIFFVTEYLKKTDIAIFTLHNNISFLFKGKMSLFANIIVTFTQRDSAMETK